MHFQSTALFLVEPARSITSQSPTLLLVKSTKNLKFETVLNQAVMISVESLPIALTIVIIAAAVIALQVAKQFLIFHRLICHLNHRMN